MSVSKWVCPTCKKPEAVAGYLGWRSCKGCGWEEKRPTWLEEVPPETAAERRDRLAPTSGQASPSYAASMTVSAGLAPKSYRADQSALDRRQRHALAFHEMTVR